MSHPSPHSDVHDDIQLRESTPLDSRDLNNFFSSIATEGKISLKVRRQIDFFSFYQRLNLKFKNYIFESTEQKTAQQVFTLPTALTEQASDLTPPEAQSEILGTASFLFQNRTLHNKIVKIALACDLRISNKRKAILNWSRFFLPKISKLKIDEQIDHFITVINLTDSKAINAFLRPRQLDSYLPIYELIQRFNLVTIHGFFPLGYKLHKNISVSYANEHDKAPLIEYILSQLEKYDFVPAEMKSDFSQYITGSILYSFSRFLVAKDPEGKIVGCTHPINSSLLQDYFPQAYDQQATNFRQFLKFASFLRFARTLTRPFSSTNREQTLNFKILHFLFFDHPEVLKSLIHTAYQGAKNNEFILYAYQTNQYSYRPPRGSLHAEIPMGLFEIKQSDSPAYQTRIKMTKDIFLDYLWF